MKTKTCNSTEDIVLAPAFPHTGSELFRDLRASLTKAWGFQPGFAELGRIVGANPSLMHYWFQSLPHRHVISFLALLERLPTSSRMAWLDSHCRELPEINHPRLAHDLLTVGALGNVLRAKCGITWIHQGSEFHRTFLATALAHSAPRFRGRRPAISGIDIHEPGKLVPVETVTYLRELLPLRRMRKVILGMWPEVRSRNTDVLMLNGIWSTVPELHDEILDLGLERHVLVTVPQIPSAIAASGKASMRMITLSPPAASDGLIRLTVASL